MIQVTNRTDEANAYQSTDAVEVGQSIQAAFAGARWQMPAKGGKEPPYISNCGVIIGSFDNQDLEDRKCGWLSTIPGDTTYRVICRIKGRPRTPGSGQRIAKSRSH